MDEHGEWTFDLREVEGTSRRPGGERTGSLDGILSAVSNRERRAVIDSLRRAPDGTVEFDALVDSVVAEVGADDGGEVGAEERRRIVRIALHHVHLPKLAESETIHYDADAGRVRYVGGDFERALVSLVGSPGEE